jgi:hypothetical protein
MVAGRNKSRLAWLATASRARAHMYRRPVTVTPHAIDLLDGDAMAALLSRARPAVILQAASLQPGAVISGQRNAWADLVAKGGLSASAVFQALLSSRVARAAVEVLPGTHFVNACFPDVVNGMIVALGTPVTCGIGNVQILAHAFGGSPELPHGADLKMLCHYQNLAAWRRQPQERSGANCRVWIDGREIGDVFGRFAAVQLTPEPVIDISGAAAAPLLMALAHGHDWHGHAPGPEGLPGGYPIRLNHGRLALDLPPGIDRETARRWNAAHEQASGLTVDGHGYVHYTGKLHDALAVESPELARGFHIRDLEAVFIAMQQLRERLNARPV